MLAKMEEGSPEYFRMLHRFLEQMQRQIGFTIEQVEEEKIPQIATNTTATATAQTSADNAATVIKSNPSVFHDWTSIDDGTGTFTAGDPTRDLGIELVNKDDDDQLVTRVLRGTLTSASGTIAVTAVSDSADTGYSTAFVLVDDGTNNVRADITITYPDGSERQTSVSWIARDTSSATSIPSTGGGK